MASADVRRRMPKHRCCMSAESLIDLEVADSPFGTAIPMAHRCWIYTQNLEQTVIDGKPIISPLATNMAFICIFET